ncbi:DUF192 domain-containing protein [Oceanibium sediminis]|uniref:DUF192 domain-containing protein n=1 Tax=Oceanibium sediminis TaxID=2026339 RepID=UPI000DD402D4|nr:DUF192 domain-containing protein [Oceanibium sediminis]
MKGLLLALALALAVSVQAQAAFAACSEGAVDVRMGDTSVRFVVEIADTVDERAVGLMNRESMPQFDGMLFVYDSPRPVAFWMKNTLIPLDMLFADASGTVQRIHQNATPRSLESIPGGDDIQFVLEINGGLSAMLGLAPGAELRHPAIGEGAAWPCS